MKLVIRISQLNIKQKMIILFITITQNTKIGAGLDLHFMIHGHSLVETDILQSRIN